jgi:hypothetical protein
MILIFYEDICMAILFDSSQLMFFSNEYTGDATWNVFFNKLEYLI